MIFDLELVNIRSNNSHINKYCQGYFCQTTADLSDISVDAEKVKDLTKLCDCHELMNEVGCVRLKKEKEELEDWKLC